MKRLHNENINTPEHYVEVWSNRVNRNPAFDTVRQNALIKHVKNGDTVLDVGAGVYGSCQFIAEKTKIKATLTCIDFSTHAMDLVCSTNKNIDFVIGNVEKMPFADNSFDHVIAGEIIEHIENPSLFAKELARVCRGVISLTTVDTECAAAIAHGDYPEHLWEFTPDDLIHLFAPFGTVEYGTVGNYHLIYCFTNG